VLGSIRGAKAGVQQQNVMNKVFDNLRTKWERIKQANTADPRMKKPASYVKLVKDWVGQELNIKDNPQWAKTKFPSSMDNKNVYNIMDQGARLAYAGRLGLSMDNITAKKTTKKSGAATKARAATPAAGSPASPAAPAAAAGGLPAATGQDSAIEGYVQQWTNTIRGAKDPAQKLALAKEVVNFLADRGNQPTAERGKEQALAAFKAVGGIGNTSQNAKFIRAIKNGMRMEARDYLLACQLLEAVGLTWVDLGIAATVMLSEDRMDHVILGAL
jgi:hypothetical protein